MSMSRQHDGFENGSWLRFLRRYLLASFLLNMIWEFVQMPLYTLWQEGSRVKIIAFGLHCTAGDAAIASFALLSALLIAGCSEWPRRGYHKIAYLTIGFGFAYTAYSEWLNVYVRKSWAYSPLMPLLPPFDLGLAPLLQWLIVPSIILFYCRVCQRERRSGDS